jgi:PAS domain-containing protein
MSVAPASLAELEDLRQHKLMFDNTWTLATVLATALVVLCWYFRLAEVSIGPIICTLAGLALAQLGINSFSGRAASAEALRLLALWSQLTGTLLLGIGWHLFGGLQQPLFPLFVVLPLLPAALVLRFWQEQVALLGLLVVLISGVALSPDTNSFIEERYGIGIAPGHGLPVWLPKSHVAFPDVSTSPAYNLMLITTVAVVGIAVSTTARAFVGRCQRATSRAVSLEGEVARLLQLNAQLVSKAPSAEVLVSSTTGRIVVASERFARAFGVAGTPGGFLLDTVAFAYPAVIRRLMTTGGEEIQGATLHGREVVLRVRAEILGTGAAQVTAMDIEPSDETCWRGALDALDDPVVVLSSRGVVAFLNRSAVQVLGGEAVGAPATQLFDTAEAWWDIAPLESARRIVERGSHRYLASVHRERVAESIGELCIVQLREHPAVTLPA